MTRKQDSVPKQNWKDLVTGQKDFLQTVVREVVQQMLELEMEETLQAGKGERTPERLGYRWADADHASGQAGVAGTAGPTRAIPDGDFRTISEE